MFKRYTFMEAAGDGGAGGGGGADAAAAAAAAVAAGGDGGKKPDSVLDGGADKLEIPERFQVKDDKGVIDQTKSMIKLSRAYGELDTKMKSSGLPPESAEKYELEDVQGFDIKEFKADPATQSFLKSAHSQGMTNKQVNFVISQYLALAPDLAGAAQQLSNDECIAQLRQSEGFKLDSEFSASIKGANHAASKLAESLKLTFADVVAAGLGNNPLFIRLMTALSQQMGEDTIPNDDPLNAGGGGGGTFEEQNAALLKELAAIPVTDQKGRQAVLAKQAVLFEKRYGPKNQKLFGNG